MSLLVTQIQGNSQRLDGGAMFGNAPRVMWQRWIEPDELGRIPLCCRCMLVDDGQRRVLCETGIGSFFEPALKERYGVVEDEHVLLRSLQQRGLGHEDIDVVILSHLHFDHTGGLLSAHEPGAPPRLLFPNARLVVSKTAFERARNPHLRDRASFIPELPQMLLQSGRLELVDPTVSELPWLGARFRFSTTDGHTPGMLHTEVTGAQQSVFFCADLIPGRAWVNVPITMGYDRYPEHLIDEKAALLPRLSAARTWLFFTHDHETAAARVAPDAKGRWAAVETSNVTDLDLDLPSP